MGPESGKIKTVQDNWNQKDWDLHARIIVLLLKKRKTITEMSNDIGEYLQHVTSCIWGIPGRENQRIRNKIAAYLETTAEELFSKDSAA